jgi:hypothetical protein
MEIEPRYVDVAIRRWQAFTGKDAVDSDSGRTFDQVAAERTDAADVLRDAPVHQVDQSESDEALKTVAADPEE